MPPKKKIRPRQQPFRKGEAKTKYQYDRLLRLAQILLDEANAAARRAEANGEGAERANAAAGTVMNAMLQQANEVPFTGPEYQRAAESQRQLDVEKWHDIEKGLEASFMAQLGVDLGVPLIKSGLNWLRNKAISPAARQMMNPENFVFDGPNIKPVKLNVPSLEESLASLELPLGGYLRETLLRKPQLQLPQPKRQLGLPAYKMDPKLDIPEQDAGLYDITDGDLFGIRLADTALEQPIRVSPHDMPSSLFENPTGNSAKTVVDNIYKIYTENLPLWLSKGIRPPLPYITSVGDNSLSVGFRPQWYRMISTPTHLERMNTLAGPTRDKLIANLSPEAKSMKRAREMQEADLFDMWLGPEARSPQQIAIDDEINAFDANWENRLLFDTNVNSLYNSGLITPRHKTALINSDEPLKYFGGAVQRNIMKKATQNYFKDIKAAKQKDYARRVMEAREKERIENLGLNDRADAVYSDLLGSVKPLLSLNSLINDANQMVGQIRGIGDIVEDTFNNYKAWKADPNPAGWQLKYLMEGNKLERQLSKDGNISINAINDQVKNASDIEKYVTDKVLKEQFAGQTKVKYSDFKHAILNELVSYNKTPSERWLDYGLSRIGYGSWEDAGRVKLDTYTFSTPRISEGSNKHFNNNTLGHSRTFVSEDEPDVMHVLESLSDWGQSKISTISKELYEAALKQLDDNIETAKSNRDFFLRRLEGDSPTLDDANSRDVLTLNINMLQNQRAELIERGVTDPHTTYLHKNWESRLIQENMLHAADKGLTKMRYPTEETAAKIEGYSKTKRLPHDSVLKQLRDDIKLKTSLLNIESKVGINYEGGISGMSYHAALRDPALPDEIKQMIRKYNQLSEEYVYPEEHRTILRKYSEFPKKFKKIYKNQEVREITDSKGNTWYEVDVPKNIGKRERAYSIVGTAVAGGTAAATLKPLKKQ